MHIHDVIHLSDYSLSGQTNIYVVLFDPENADQIFNNTTGLWVANTVANRQTADVVAYATEADVAGGGTGDFSIEIPSAIYSDPTSDSYRTKVSAVFYERLGASPAVDDNIVGRADTFEIVPVIGGTITSATPSGPGGGQLTISQTWEVGGALADPTSVKLSDPTGAFGVRRGDTLAAVVADDTDMTRTATGTYEYSFDYVTNVAYTAYVEIVYGGATYHFERDIPAIAELGMSATYSSLLERVGHFLFGIRSGYSTDQTEDILDCVRDGLRDVYVAHPWSFFRPVKEITTTAPYSTGTITIASGVVTLSGGTFPSWAAVGVLKLDNEYYDVNTRDSDTQVTLEDTSVAQAAASSYELGRPEYDLPSSFEEIVGKELAYEPGQSDFYPPVKRRHDDQVREWRQDDPYHDRPLYFSTRAAEFDPTVGSRRRLVLYPTPDAAYVLKVPMKLRPTMIDAEDQYPVGGESLSQLIIEACLAAAERNFDEDKSRHRERFDELLPVAIAADLEITSPTQLGPDAPGSGKKDAVARSVRMGDITLNGVTL